MSILRASLALFPLMVLASCSNKEDSPPPANPPADSNPAAPSAAVVAVLAKADAVDGTIDKVVHRCAGCALGMDGMAKHSMKVGGYTMHFCKEGCLAMFSDDTEKAILALKVKD